MCSIVLHSAFYTLSAASAPTRALQVAHCTPIIVCAAGNRRLPAPSYELSLARAWYARTLQNTSACPFQYLVCPVSCAHLNQDSEDPHTAHHRSQPPNYRTPTFQDTADLDPAGSAIHA
ncbi:hypothetical protein EVG20_g3362 [Dentipellis fragilis]|uniref:Uncharacterized protein n=1 Tax=Dentipellis fragilis TaxID=205917 RepID=A0A4Y9Z4X1_9AGAM|nr:hypothetical protein EVG20_g3362 [Dentipellis fragilis]